MSRARSKVRAATLASVTMRRASDAALPAPKAGDISGALALSLPVDETPLDFASASAAVVTSEATVAAAPSDHCGETKQVEEPEVEPPPTVRAPTPVEDVAPAAPLAMAAEPVAAESKPAPRGGNLLFRPPWAWWS